MRAALRMLVYLACGAIGALLVANLFQPTLVDRIAAFLKTEEGRLISSGLAIILLLSPLAILLRWWQASRRAREISYQTENGRISVGLIAIEEALTRAIEGEPEVKKAHVRVFEDRVKRSVVIEAVMTLWEVPNVTDRNRFCQRLLRRRFAELMPEQTAVQVNLTVHRLTTRRPETAPAPAPAPAAANAGAGKAAGPAAALEKREPEAEATYRDPLMDSALLPVAGADEDLYVGPTYPVVKEEDDEAQYYPRPATEKKTKSKTR
jgi:hypothetical protein